eukprot:scaffold27460_cov56-Cyclotella_meneghiniana.AAC.5
MITSLADLAFNEAMNAFERSPFHVDKCLKKEIADKFFSMLNTEISPSVTAVYVNNDEYFKRALKDAGQSNKICADGDSISYKQLFFELHMQEVVDRCSNESQLIDEIRLFSDYIHTLSLSIPHGFPVEALCFNLPNLTRLELKFVDKCLDMPFHGLGPALASSSSLVSLVLKNNQITDEDIERIFNNSSEHCNISHLDLSHNQISCAGVESVVKKFISPHSSLSSLDLSGNKLCDECAATLGLALVDNESLMSLNLSLNGIGDTGGVALFESMRQNNVLRSINISSNRLGSNTARVISEVLRGERMDSVVAVSNLFSPDDLDMLELYDNCHVGRDEENSTYTIDYLASEVPSSN